jgi:uncharacterized protein YgiM (DUF1202 family)
MGGRSIRFGVGCVFAFVTIAIAASAPRFANAAETKIVPETGAAPSSAATEPEATPAAAPTPAHPRAKTKTSSSASTTEVEPAHAKVKLLEDTWVYSRPSKSSKHVRRVHAGKYVNVTGSTRYYLRVELKDGKTGYISPSTVELVSPVDKTFTLTSDSPVYDKPNRWAKKVSEVHKGHSVHVVGLALSYMKIKMKSGLEGFIPTSALE